MKHAHTKTPQLFRGRFLFLAAAVLALASAFAVPAAGQEAGVSRVADMPLPIAPVVAPDAAIVAAGESALVSEAKILGMQCSASEFHVWRTQSEDAVTEIVGKTHGAFAAAGWVMAEQSATERLVYSGVRGEDGMVAVWQADGATLSLGLCAVAASAIPAATPQTPAGGDAAAADGAEEASDPALVSATMALAGLALILWRIFRRRRKAAIATWPQTEGRIVQSDIEEVDVSTSDDESADYRYEPKVRYRYDVGGTTFDGARLGMDQPRFGTREAAASYLLENFATASVVPVYFNPAKPKDAVLERPAEDGGRGRNLLHWGLVAIGAALLLFGLLGLAGTLMG